MKKYTILKNCHYAFFLLGRIFGWHYDKTYYNIFFKFSKECWWSTPRNSDDYDLNKLAGFSFGLFGIHKNSVRITWRPNFEKKGFISLYGYTYDSAKKEHTAEYLAEVEVEKNCICLLSLNEDSYIFDMGSFGSIEMDNKTPDSLIQKEIYPYFGGNNKSPQKMSIWMKIKKGY